MAVPKRDNKMSNDERIAVLEITVSHVHETLERIEKNMDKNFTDLNHKMDKVNDRIDKVNDRLWSNFFWTIGGFVGTWVILSHVLHWF